MFVYSCTGVSFFQHNFTSIILRLWFHDYEIFKDLRIAQQTLDLLLGQSDINLKSKGVDSEAEFGPCKTTPQALQTCKNERARHKSYVKIAV